MGRTSFDIVPSMKPAETSRAEDSDDRESFNEEECLFAEGDVDNSEWSADDDDDNGPFAHYSKRPGRPSAFYKQHHHPHSLHYNHEEDISHDLNNHVHVHQMRPRLSAFRHECTFFSSYDEQRSTQHINSASPDTSMAGKRIRRPKKNSLSVRESLLTEAWERKKKGLLLSEGLGSFKETAVVAQPELLGRSSSDCGEIAEANGHGHVRRSRARSLTDDDFEELRGCLDLGFRFDQSSVPDLCETLPALEVYCAVAQNLQESPILNSPVKQSPLRCSSPSPTPSWRISSPGDDPKDVKGRLRHWAQAVACDAKLCY